MKNLLILLLAGAYSIIAGGPGNALPFEQAVLALSGASSLEELSESEVERYETFLSHPLQINLAPRSKLLSSGLMSRYQVASLCDYRERTGDVLGVAELSFVDGFGPETAAALACFVGFESRSAPGSRPYSRLKQSALLRSGIKAQGQDGAGLSGYGFKYTMEYGQRAGFWWSGRDGTMPGTFSLALCGRGSQVLVLGDFNARFGQGLALWSGMSLSGFSGTGAFVRNGSGLSPTGSFSPSHRGVGFETGTGPWTFSAAVSVPGLRERCDGLSGAPISFMPMVACSWLGKSSNAGIQAYLQTGDLIGGGENVLGISRAAATADFKAGIGKWTVYGEGGWGISRVLNTYRNSSYPGDMYVKVVENKAFAALLGVMWAPAWKRRMALLARCYPAGFPGTYSGAARSASKVGDEQGVALGLALGALSFTFDAARHPAAGTCQFKSVAVLSSSFKTGSAVWSPSLRWSERLKREDIFADRPGAPAAAPRWRHDLRADIDAALSSGACAHLRLNGLLSSVAETPSFRKSAMACLSYLELGWKAPARGRPVISGSPFSAFLRFSLFRADDWEARIYCHERDVPGSFSVPAFYGRGWKLSLLSTARSPFKGTLPSGRTRHALSLRASVLRYFSPTADGTPTGAPRLPQTELKLQYKMEL